MNARKLLERTRNNPTGVRFSDLVALAEAFGYRLDRTRGSDRFLVHATVPQRLSFQPRRDGKAKEYQIKQLLSAVDSFGLRLEDEP